MNFLKTILGEKWKPRFISLLFIYAILLFWPTIVFFRNISFQPATFVQEWIKSVCSISIIFIVLEYQKYLFELNKIKAQCRQVIETKIIQPLNAVVNIFPDCSNPTDKQIDEFISAWRKAYNTILLIDMYSFNIKFKNKSISDFQNELQLQSIDKTIVGSMNTTKRINFCKTIEKINRIISLFNNELENLK